jgi:hypothetical protein
MVKLNAGWLVQFADTRTTQNLPQVSSLAAHRKEQALACLLNRV